jgi:hypothetical protein
LEIALPPELTTELVLDFLETSVESNAIPMSPERKIVPHFETLFMSSCFRGRYPGDHRGFDGGRGLEVTSHLGDTGEDVSAVDEDAGDHGDQG